MSRAGKMSIQGVQPKLSVRLDAKAGVFVIVDQGGRFLLKPQHAVYPNLPENEGLTMHLAKICGIEVAGERDHAQHRRYLVILCSSLRPNADTTAKLRWRTLPNSRV